MFADDAQMFWVRYEFLIFQSVNIYALEQHTLMANFTYLDNSTAHAGI